MFNPNAAKTHAVDAWYQFTADNGLKTKVPDWRQGVAPDGAPRITCEVVGPDAAETLHLFGSKGYLPLGQDGDLQPTYDYGDGRITVVWRRQGVWVELWVPDLQPSPAGADVAGPRKPVPVPHSLRPSGRLPFGRRTPNRPKETTA